MDKKKKYRSSGRRAEKYRGTTCLNCGHPLKLSDLYCPSCSQMNTTKPLSIKDFFGEFISSIFTYDSRLRFTLKDLLLKPGVITKNYIKGQRLKYANPFRFFLSVSIFYFLLQGIVATFHLNEGFSIMKTVTVNDGSDKAKTRTENEIAISQIDSAGLLPDQEEFRIIPESELDTLAWANQFFKQLSLYREFYKKNKINDPVIALDSMGHRNTSYNRWVYNKNKSIDRIKENPEGFANYILSKVPFFLFLFAPFYALVFWLIYSRKKFNFMEHLIFIFHLFSFVFLCMLISLIPDLLFGAEILLTISLLIIVPIYFFMSLKKFYEQSRFITLLKFVVLSLVFFVSANLTALMFLILTAAVY